MNTFEYKILLAPKKGVKAKGIKGVEAQFANALMSVMNELGAQGWEYQRCDTLPLEQRSGLRGRSTTFENMLVFRREIIATPSQQVETTEVGEVVKQIPAITGAPVASETHAPLLNPTPTDAGSSPELGAATQPAYDHVKTKTPRPES